MPSSFIKGAVVVSGVYTVAFPLSTSENAIRVCYRLPQSVASFGPLACGVGCFASLLRESCSRALSWWSGLSAPLRICVRLCPHSAVMRACGCDCAQNKVFRAVYTRSAFGGGERTPKSDLLLPSVSLLVLTSFAPHLRVLLHVVADSALCAALTQSRRGTTRRRSTTCARTRRLLWS